MRFSPEPKRGRQATLMKSDFANRARKAQSMNQTEQKRQRPPLFERFDEQVFDGDIADCQGDAASIHFGYTGTKLSTAKHRVRLCEIVKAVMIFRVVLECSATMTRPSRNNKWS